jgi:hypothetical protein
MPGGTGSTVYPARFAETPGMEYKQKQSAIKSAAVRYLHFIISLDFLYYDLNSVIFILS